MHWCQDSRRSQGAAIQFGAFHACNLLMRIPALDGGPGPGSCGHILPIAQPSWAVTMAAATLLTPQTMRVKFPVLVRLTYSLHNSHCTRFSDCTPSATVQADNGPGRKTSLWLPATQHPSHQAWPSAPSTRNNCFPKHDPTSHGRRHTTAHRAPHL